MQDRNETKPASNRKLNSCCENGAKSHRLLTGSTNALQWLTPTSPNLFKMKRFHIFRVLKSQNCRTNPIPNSDTCYPGNFE